MSSPEDAFLADCDTYDDYLNAFLQPEDFRYIRDQRICRTLIKIGKNSQAVVYTREEFETRKEAVLRLLGPSSYTPDLFSDGMTSADPVLKELAARERLNRQKIISTIIFIRCIWKNGLEVSSYKDFQNSLRNADLKIKGATDWRKVFNDQAKLRPKPSDLSFFNLYQGLVKYNNTQNYTVLHDPKEGLMFMHVGDHKKICVNSNADSYKRDYHRFMFYSENYGYVVFYDHPIRKKV